MPPSAKYVVTKHVDYLLRSIQTDGFFYFAMPKAKQEDLVARLKKIKEKVELEWKS
jgi:hypothetical protein